MQNSNRGNYWKWKFARGWPREIPGPIFTAAHIKISLQYRHDIQLNNNIHNDRNNGGGDDIEESTRLTHDTLQYSIGEGVLDSRN